MQSLKKPLLLGILFVSCFTIVSAQTKKGKRKGEFYFSWGYNTEWYTRSNVHVSQPELLNNYTFVNIKGHDHKGWDEGLQLLNKGAKATFVIPSKLAYGEQGFQVIQPYTPLVFDVEMVSFKHPDPNAKKPTAPAPMTLQQLQQMQKLQQQQQGGKK